MATPHSTIRIITDRAVALPRAFFLHHPLLLHFRALGCSRQRKSRSRFSLLSCLVRVALNVQSESPPSERLNGYEARKYYLIRW